MLLTGVACGVPASASTTPQAANTSGQIVSNCAAAKPGNSEVEEAVSGNNVYVEWIGCDEHAPAIGFARSTNGGRTFGPAMELPGSAPVGCGPSESCTYSWDPSITVSSTGTVYAAFMHGGFGVGTSPVVDVSTDHGVSFAHSYTLPEPGGTTNWGDRDFIAVGAHGELFVTWDYGPSESQLRIVCSPIGSCSFTNGDLNIVVQHSTDGGATWSAIQPLSPGYPDSGADSAPIVAQPNGTLDVLYQQMPTAPSTLALSPGHEWFTRSTDNGVTWSKPIDISASSGTESLTEWWIDGDVSTDSRGNLYATWDTQRSTTDMGWLSYSTDGGTKWSKPIKVAASGNEELTESAGVASGIADVAWQTPGPSGYATFLRPYSISKGWLTAAAMQVSTGFGTRTVWPGDTFGIAVLPDSKATHYGKQVVLTWGSAVSPSPYSEIYSAAFAPSAPGFAVGSVSGAASSTVVTVSWKKPAGGDAAITGYAVYYAHSDGTDPTKVCSTNATTFRCTNITLPLGNDLQLLVKASSALGSSTAPTAGPGPRGDWWWLWNELFAKDTIQPGECMWSFGRGYSLCMGYDGDLTEVQTSGNTTLWSLSSTIGSGALVPGSYATFQSDGNFVVYPPTGGTAIWNTGTLTAAGGHLSLQDDGNLVIYNSSNVAVCARFGTPPCALN